MRFNELPPERLFSEKNIHPPPSEGSQRILRYYYSFVDYQPRSYVFFPAAAVRCPREEAATIHYMPKVSVGKEKRIKNGSMVIPEKAAPVTGAILGTFR